MKHATAILANGHVCLWIYNENSFALSIILFKIVSSLRDIQLCVIFEKESSFIQPDQGEIDTLRVMCPVFVSILICSSVKNWYQENQIENSFVVPYLSQCSHKHQTETDHRYQQ